MKQALGLVEIQGLSTAVVVADTMAKAANIRILEIENTKGLGYMTIKIAGDVGAVYAAVNAGRQTGIANQKLVSWKVIPRPSDYVEHTFCDPTPPGTEGPSPKKPKAEAERESMTEQAAKGEAVGKPEPAAEATAAEPEPAAEATGAIEPEPTGENTAAEEQKPTAETADAIEPEPAGENTAAAESEPAAEAVGAIEPESAVPGPDMKQEPPKKKNSPRKSAGSRRKNKGDTNTI